MVEGAAVPEQDRFQIITEHPPSGLIYDPTYLGIQRTNDIVMVQKKKKNTLSTGLDVHPHLKEGDSRRRG
jgi:hypothetical protein